MRDEWERGSAISRVAATVKAWPRQLEGAWHEHPRQKLLSVCVHKPGLRTAAEAAAAALRHAQCVHGAYVYAATEVGGGGDGLVTMV